MHTTSDENNPPQVAGEAQGGAAAATAQGGAAAAAAQGGAVAAAAGAVAGRKRSSPAAAHAIVTAHQSNADGDPVIPVSGATVDGVTQQQKPAKKSRRCYQRYSAP